MIRYELNIDEDKVNDVLDKGGASYDLKGCCDIMNEQQDIIEEQDRLVEKLRWVIDVKQKYIEKIEKENDDLNKIPPKIREVWLDD